MGDNIISMKPVRQNTRVIDSAEVMGTGSWVKVRKLSVGENNAFIQLMNKGAKLASENDLEGLEGVEVEIRTILCAALLEWNWVDNDGEFLPSPHHNPSVIDALTMEESGFLTDAVRGIEREKKGKTKKTSRS